MIITDNAAGVTHSSPSVHQFIYLSIYLSINPCLVILFFHAPSFLRSYLAFPSAESLSFVVSPLPHTPWLADFMHEICEPGCVGEGRDNKREALSRGKGEIAS